MFVAVLSGGEKADALRDALERGADPKLLYTQVLARYHDLFLKWLSRLEALAVSDVVDPNVAMWIGVLTDDAECLPVSTRAGCGPKRACGRPSAPDMTAWYPEEEPYPALTDSSSTSTSCARKGYPNGWLHECRAAMGSAVWCR